MGLTHILLNQKYQTIIKNFIQMKKTNFLKGLGAKLALAVVALGAMLTSCEKEKIYIEAEKENAKINFTPAVIDPVNVTTINADFSGTDASIEGNPDIAAGSRTINATVSGGANGSTTVNYEAVPAGSTVTYSPIIILNNGLFTFKETDSKIVSSIKKHGNVNNGHSHDGSSWYFNTSDFTAKFTAEWDESTTTSIKEMTLKNDKATDYVEALIQPVSNSGSESWYVAAWEMISTEFTIYTSETTYNVVSTIDGTIVGEVVVTNPIAKVEVKEIRSAIPGHENNYHAGHSHGPSNNAGGGMGWAE
jgi:hypothetical protein